MTYTYLPLQDYIAEQSEEQISYTTLTAQFGDGYSNETGAGINNKRIIWNITYNTLTEANYATIMNYLDTVQGNTSFKATPRGSSEQIWRLIPTSVKANHIVKSNITNQVYRTLSFQLKKVPV